MDLSISNVLAKFQEAKALADLGYAQADANEFQVFYEIQVPKEISASGTPRVLRVAMDRQGLPLFVVRDLEAVLGLRANCLAKTLTRYAKPEDPPFLFCMHGFTAKTQICLMVVVCTNTGIAKMAALQYETKAKTQKAQDLFKLIFAWICALRATVKLDADGKTPIQQPFALGVVDRLVNYPKPIERALKPQFMKGFSATFASKKERL